MHHIKVLKTLSVISLLFVIIAFTTACNAKTQSKNTAVRIGFFPNITHSQALIGKAQGQFQKALGEKNKIEWKQFNAGPAEIEAMLSGQIDIGYIGPGPAINGYARSNGEIQIIAGAADAGAILISRKDLKIKNLKELSGKKVAIPQFGNTQDLCLRAILKENGLKDTTKGGTVEIVQAENPDIETLLDRGEIDAALVPEPWGSRMIKEVNANVVLDYDSILNNGNYATAVVIARKEFIKEHPDIVEKFLKTHVQLTDFINNNREKAMEIVNSQLNELTKKPLSEDVLTSSFNRLKITYDPEKNSVTDFVNLSLETGFLKQKPDLKELFNLDILNKILKEEGRPQIN